MTLAANCWVVEDLGSSQWLVEAPDVHALRVCLLPGWALQEAGEQDDEEAASTAWAAPGSALPAGQGSLF